jgi:hypothetical protein
MTAKETRMQLRTANADGVSSSKVAAPSCYTATKLKSNRRGQCLLYSARER